MPDVCSGSSQSIDIPSLVVEYFIKITISSPLLNSLYIFKGTPIPSSSYCLSMVYSSSSPVSLSMIESIFKARVSNTMTSPSLRAVKYALTIP